ncbi:MAG: pyridoxal phosphate-dependent aminotransferase [Armatimonadota bacterium]
MGAQSQGEPARTRQLSSFKVMDILEEAKELEARGEDIVHLEVGQPDFPTPGHIVEAAERAIAAGATQYTHSLGLLALREAICEHYAERYGAEVSPEQIVVTSGTSPALLLLFSALCEAGDEVLLSDPHFACYPNFLRYLGVGLRYFGLSAAGGYQYDPEAIGDLVGPRTKAILVNSPANPTGATLSGEALAEIAELGPYVISDEIYHGLSYGPEEDRSILEVTRRAFVLNGFSKRYAMTGWRLGYVIAPPEYIPAMQVMQQNFFICAADFVQHAGLQALRHGWPDVERMCQQYRARREVLVPGLRELGFEVPYEPQGAFYVLAGAKHLVGDSLVLSRRILHEAKVAVAPGIDFGSRAEGHLRFSYANSRERIAEGLRRLGEWVERQ